MDFNCTGSLIYGFLLYSTINVFFPYDFLNNIIFSLADLF